MLQTNAAGKRLQMPYKMLRSLLQVIVRLNSHKAPDHRYLQQWAPEHLLQGLQPFVNKLVAA